MALSNTFEFYTERADQAAAEAGTAELANVRERALRSEKTWRGLAVLAQNMVVARATAVVERDERRAADAGHRAALAAADSPLA